MFSNTAGIGCISKEKRKTLHESHKQSVEHVYKDSIEEVLMEKIWMYEELNGTDIMTDARNNWRINAKDTSVVIGEKNHKVLQCQHVTKADDAVSQRHELKGTREMYRYFEAKDTSINVQSHDRNMTVNKFVKICGYTLKQNDSWHIVKSMKKALKSISSTKKAKLGSNSFMIRKNQWQFVCTGHTETVKESSKTSKSVSNIMNHYTNEHSGCHPTSWCKLDLNCKPSRQLITYSKAEKLLKTTIENSMIYKRYYIC